MAGLPWWVYEQARREEARFKQLQRSLPTGTMNVRDSFHTARGYRDLGMKFTAGEGEYPRNPLVVAEIKNQWPDLVPLWCRWAFRGPDGEDIVFGRHAIGRINRDPKLPAEEFAVDKPFGYGVYRNPHQLILIWQGSKPDKRGVDLPGEYLPFDWNLLEFLRKSEFRGIKAEKERLARVEDEQIKAAANRREEQDRINADLQNYVNKKLDTVSEVELKEWALGGKYQKPSPKVSLHIRRQ